MENTTRHILTKSRPTFLRRLFTWKMARRLLVGLAAFATLIAIGYAVENWRGKRAWQTYKREAEARGEVLDWNVFIPPAVPADDNFFDAPKMAEWFVRPGFFGASTITNELRLRLSNTNTTSNITTETDARTYLVWSDQFETDFDRIRDALKRPYSRIGGDYSKPYAISIPDLFTVRAVAQTLSQRAKCALLISEPEKALHDLILMHDLCRLLESKPTGQPMTLVAAMINVAVTGLYVDTITYGMRSHTWHEPQLAALQKQLQEINLVPFVKSALEFELVATIRTLETSTAKDLNKILNREPQKFWQKMEDPLYLLLTVAPRGWIHQNMINHARLMEKSTEGINVDRELILPRKQAEITVAIEKAISHFSPYNYFISISVPNVSRATLVLARNQTKANEAATVCALERYRMALGNYPETLDLLTPDFIQTIPHDVIGGQPLKYRRTDDGKFLLYSVGWNEKDDGGTIVAVKGNDIPLEGDWVWMDSAK